MSNIENLTPADTDAWDHLPSVSGSFIAWEGEGDPTLSDSEVFLWNRDTEIVQQLTNNSVSDKEPVVYRDGRAVWYQCDGENSNPWECLSVDGQPGTGDDEIMYWNGSTVSFLTNNTVDDGDADIAAHGVVWEQGDGSDKEIMYWNGSSVEPLTDNSVEDDDPRITGNFIVWHACDGPESVDEYDENVCTTDTEIYLYDLSDSSTVQLTNNSVDDEDAATDGVGVAWQACDGGDNELGWCGGDFEIFYWPGFGDPIQLTDNDFHDWDADLSDGQVVWSAEDVEGSYVIQGLYYWKDGETTRLRTVPTPYGEVNVEIDGERLVWQESETEDWESDMDVLTATVPEPAAGTLGAAALFALGGLRRRRVRG